MRRHILKRVSGWIGAPLTPLTPRAAAISVIVIVVVAVAGPFGTFNAMDLGRRLLYWGAVGGSSVLIGGLCRMQVEKQLPDCERFLQRLAVFALAALPITIDVWAISQMSFWGSSAREGIVSFLFFVPLIMVAVSLLYLMLPNFSEAGPRPGESDAQASEEGGEEGGEDGEGQTRWTPRLLRRISGAPDARVLHLSARDHIVEITTCAGQDTVRMRFRDALDEIDGLRVHRSHWVAREAIDRIERDGARVFVLLRNGERIPVSRNYQTALKERGLL